MDEVTLHNNIKRTDNTDPDLDTVNSLVDTAQNSVRATSDSIESRLEPVDREFLKIEKSLASLGFFSPKSKTLKNHRVKRVQLSRQDDKTRITAQVTIEPSVTHGLPTIAHQDKMFALQKIIQDRQATGVKVENPIGFTSAQILRLLGLRVDAGKNYDDIDEWLNVMTATTIVSEGAVYLAERKNYAKDRFHVFDRAVTFGKEMPDGTIADRNYVWLSEWQIENINRFHYLPIDFEAYKRLRNSIAKALIPLLQVWFFASQAKGIFEKRYDEFCQQLGVREYAFVSKIKEKLSPALDELVSFRYLKAWEIKETPRGFKVVLWPGLKFFEDRELLSGRTSGRIPPQIPAATKNPKQAGLSEAKPRQASFDLAGHLPQGVTKSPALVSALKSATIDQSLIDALIAEGVSSGEAARLAKEKPEECRRQLMYLPYQKIEKGRGGFLRSAIEAAYAEPVGFAVQKKERNRAAREHLQLEAQKAQRDPVVENLRAASETLLEEATEAQLEPLLAFIRQRKERDQKAFRPGSKPHRAIDAAYETEALQLQLIAEFYAAETCPVPKLASLILEYDSDKLKDLIKAHYSNC